MQVQVVENVLKLNDEVASLNRQTIRGAGLFCLNLIGAPGCGKTSLLENTLRQLRSHLRIGVIVGDLTTARDGDRLAKWSPHVVQINTGKGCHLEAHQVRQALTRLDLSQLDVLVIENVGNLICPVGFDLGQDVKVGMFSVTEGDDKPAKHPYIVHEAGMLLLNKIDLLPYVSFNREIFLSDIRKLNATAPVLELSATGNDLERWIKWLTASAAAARNRSAKT